MKLFIVEFNDIALRSQRHNLIGQKLRYYIGPVASVSAQTMLPKGQTKGYPQFMSCRGRPSAALASFRIRPCAPLGSRLAVVNSR